MPQLYSRVFLQILDSSLANDWRARYVFEDFLKLANEDGVVDMTREAIARRTNVPLEIVAHGIEVLEAPDAGSRDPSEEGRRLIRLDDHRDWGWRVVNWCRYDAIRSSFEHRAAKARDMKRYREKLLSEPSPKSTKNDLLTSNTPPEDPLHVTSRSLHVDYMSSTKARKAEAEHVEAVYAAYPKKCARKAAEKAIRKALMEVGYETLLERVKAYSEARKGQDPQFTPHPATWFNQGRFNDDPATWKSTPSVNGGSSHRPTVADERNKFIGGQEVWEATSGKLALEAGKGFGPR